jgi:sulfonate transport system substrate-binding protein
MKKRVSCCLILGIIFTTSFSACNSSGTNRPAQIEKVSFATSKNAWCALTILAQKKGFFQEEGIDADLEYVQAAKLAMDALVGGSSQFSNVVETNMAFLGYTGNENVEIVATHCESHDGAIVARRSAGIERPQDLEGKKLGILQGTTSQVFADRFIEKYGIDPLKVTIVNLTPVAVQSSMLTKEIDAGSVWQPFVSNIEKQLGTDAIVFSDKDVYTAYMNIAILKDWAQQHPQTVVRVLKAHIKAEDFAKTSRDEAIAIVAQEIGLEKDTLGQIWNEYVYHVDIKPELLKEIQAEGAWIQKSQPQFQGKPIPSFDDWAVNKDFLGKIDSARIKE